MAQLSQRRLHIVLETKDVHRLEKLSKKEALSVSWLIRRAIHQWLEGSGALSTTLSSLRHYKKDPLLAVIGLFNSGGISNSQIDQEVYGQ